MANKEDSTRVQMTFPTALIESIDEFCDRLHVPRNAWIVTTLAQAVYDQSHGENTLD